MFNLDINFLNDRPDLKPGGSGAGTAARTGARTGFSSGGESKTPLYAGIAALVGLLGLTALGYGYFTWQKGSLTERQAELDSKLGSLEVKKKELEAAKKQVAAAEGEIKALVSVFGQIKPWSAIAQDVLRDRLPDGIQITGIVQGNPQGSGQTATGANAIYPRTITLKGIASDFGRVNDYIVLLQKSSFLNPNQTKLLSSERQDRKATAPPSLPNPIEAGAGNSALRPLKLVGPVTFSIQTELTDISSSELLKELERKGAVGLINRFEALKNKGVKP